MKSKLTLFIFLLAIGGSASAQLVLPICSVNLPCPGFPLGSVQAPIDQNGWRNFKVTLTQNVTSFSFVGIPPSPAQAAVNIIFTQDATGGRTVTFAAGISSPCTVTGTANATTLCQFEYDGTAGAWIGISGGGAGITPGAWQRQGTIMAPLSGEIALQEPQILYEGSPQILTNVTANVFKMVFSDGFSSPSLQYAESVDGLSWVRGTSALVASCAHSNWLHVASTYYLYCSPLTAGVGTQILLYTSSTSNGTYTLVGTMLNVGAGGTWDATQIANPSVFLEKDGQTWAMMYEGLGTLFAGWGQGLATATSPSGPWTKSASNPVFLVSAGAADASHLDVHLTNGTYYAWMHSSTNGTTHLPGDLYFTSSQNLISWSAPTLIVSRVGADEGANQPTTGQIADPRVIQVNGSTYLFYDAFPTQSSTNTQSHLKLMISPGTIAQIVTSSQYGVGTLFDNTWMPLASTCPLTNGTFGGLSMIQLMPLGQFTTGLTPTPFSIQEWETGSNTLAVAQIGFNYEQPSCAGLVRTNTNRGGWRLQFNTSATQTNNAMFLTASNTGGTDQTAIQAAFDTNGNIENTLATVIAGGSAAALTGTGACATITTQSGGSWAGSAKCTGATAASTLTITPGPLAPNGYICNVQDETTRANLFQQTSHTTAACVLTITSVTQNDVFVFSAIAF